MALVAALVPVTVATAPDGTLSVEGAAALAGEKMTATTGRTTTMLGTNGTTATTMPAIGTTMLTIERRRA